MITGLKDIDMLRAKRIATVADSHKTTFGQYLTPAGIAEFMASLLERYETKENVISLLDPGAGLGILFSSFLEKKLAEQYQGSINIDAYEIDTTILPQLNEVIERFRNRSKIHTTIIQKDFIQTATYELCAGTHKTYSHIIMNPPYKKIASTSDYRSCLRDIGVETVNLYSAFVAVAVRLLALQGVVVAIIPRSFCNGLYFLPFRKFLLSKTELQVHIHTFKSRKDAFKDEDVLQENVIIVLRKGIQQQPHVCISSSGGKDFSDYAEHPVSFEDVVKPGDEQFYFSIPANGTNGNRSYNFSTTKTTLALKYRPGRLSISG